MKNKFAKVLPLFCVAALSAAVLIFSPGCASTSSSGGGNFSTNSTPVQKVTLATVQLAAKSAAYFGATIAKDKKPTLLPIFEDVRTGLTALVAAGNFSAEDLTALIKKIPLDELKGDAGSMVIGEAVVLWDQFGHQLLSLDKNEIMKTYLVPMAQAILDGLNLALGTSSTSKAGS